MSDKKKKNPMLGRGRGISLLDGPWKRSNKLEEVKDVRQPNNSEEKEFLYKKELFPPLLPPKTSNSADGEGNQNTVDSPISKDKQSEKSNDVKTLEKVLEKPISKEPVSKEPVSTEHVSTEHVSKEPISQHECVPKESISQEPVPNDVPISKLEETDIDDNKKSEEISKSDVNVLENAKTSTLTVDTAVCAGENCSTCTLAPCQVEVAWWSETWVYSEMFAVEDRRWMSQVVPLEPLPEMPIVVSNLSPYAKEFVPRFSNMNPTANDFIPNNNVEQQNEPDSNNCLNISDEASAQQELSEDIEETFIFCYTKLTEKPAIFDELVKIVVPHLVKSLNDPELSKKIATTLYNYALGDVNFSYIAVKFLVYLISVDIESNNSIQLRNTLLNLAREETLKIQLFLSDQREVSESPMPVLLFLTELFIQLEVGSKRMLVLGKAVVQTLRIMLHASFISPKERILNTVNIVKLIGAFIDQDDRDQLDGLFDDLKNLLREEESNIDVSLVEMAVNLISLRDSNWGETQLELPPIPPDQNNAFENVSEAAYMQLPNGIAEGLPNEIPPNGIPPNGIPPNGIPPNGIPPHGIAPNGIPYEVHPAPFDINAPVNVAVFYGPDGHIITYEEQLFLECEMVNQLSLDQISEPSPNSMDGEMLEAYNEFLLTIPAQHMPMMDQQQYFQ